MGKRYVGTWDSVNTHTVPQWYKDAKFGIFIHWGIYSVPAYAPHTWELGEVPPDENWFCNNPYAEWYYNSVEVGKGPTYEHHNKTYGEDFEYKDFLPIWKAENWNSREWAELFKEAGAQYVVLTAKHHDGFCLFPSKYTDFHAKNHGPKRDIVGALTESVKEQGIRMGIYYSGLVDWQYADDPIFDQEEQFTKACPTYAYADYAYNQCCELVDTYHPSLLWNDLGWPVHGENQLPFLLSHYYNTVEEGVVNDRFNGLYSDYTTKEYHTGDGNRSAKWEMCRGMGLSFGYNANESEDQTITPDALINLLIETVANNGNLLLNIGPRADGTIPEVQMKCLRELGIWLKTNGEAIYGTRCSDCEAATLADGVKTNYTQKDDATYLFLSGMSNETTVVEIPGLSGCVTALDQKIHVKYENTDSGLRITVHTEQSCPYPVTLKIKSGQEEK